MISVPIGSSTGTNLDVFLFQNWLLSIVQTITYRKVIYALDTTQGKKSCDVNASMGTCGAEEI